jgi:hypothetical protein
MKISLGCVLAPPLVASQYSCGSSCAAPVTILWLGSIFCMLLGLLGGPLEKTGISWPTFFVGLGLWLISAIWTWLATRKIDGCRVIKN